MTDEPLPEFDYGYLHDHSRLTRFRENPVDIGWFTAAGREPFVDLDGDWHFEIDPYDSGLRGEWFRESSDDDSAVGPPDCDFDAWETAPVPGCWNNHRNDLKFYEGSAWYVRDFSLEEVSAGFTYPIAFSGTCGDTIVFINGEYCGYNDVSGIPFAVNATCLLKAGKNRITVWLTNRRHEDGVPGEFYDWFNYGGIYRSVHLHKVPELHVRRWKLALDNLGAPVFELILNNPVAAEGTLTIGDRVFPFRTNKDGRCSMKPEFSPELWHPGEPKLYNTAIRLGADHLSDRVGFRTVSADREGIRINGRHVVFRGLAVHEDHPKTGRALTRNQRLEILDHAKSLGANALRLAHYPHDGEMTRLADEAGVLLWEEIPVYWHLNFAYKGTLRKARRLMEALILRDENRAGVIMWSIGNENPDSKARLDFMSDLAALCRKLDPTRLVTAACLADVSNYRITDRLADVVDVVSVNEYYGWYYMGVERVGEIVRSRPDKPVVISEFGAGATHRGKDGAEGPWSEEFQARFYDNQFRALAGIDNLAGYIPWLLYDFPSPRRLNAHQKGLNRKGLISHDRSHRKLACETIRKWYMGMDG